MKTSTRSLLAISLSLAAWQALPCWDYEDPTMNNHFHCVPQLPEIEQRNIDESVAFWASYTGQPVSDELRYAVSYLPVWQFDDDEPTNSLLLTLKAQGKTEAIEYLRLNAELLSLQEAASSWDYKKVTPADYEALMRQIDALKANGELNRRKTFLRMRCLFSLKDYDACMRLWDNFASKWDPSPLRRRMEGYVAGIYYRRKQYDKAIPMFFDLGDDGSIQLCVNRMLANTSIEQEYTKDPNSPILGYILEDYANYYYHAKRNDYWEPGKDNPIWTTVTQDAQRNIALAQRVVREGKAKDLQMWQAFAGFLQLVDGQAQTAYQTFSQAEALRGGGVVGQCLRAYKFVAALQMPDKIPGFEPYMVNELHYWMDQNQFSSEVEGHTRYSLTEVEFNPYVQQYVDTKGDPMLSFSAETTLIPYAYGKVNREMTLDEVLAFRQYLSQESHSDLEAFFKQHSYANQVSEDEFNELIGTKLIRLGRFNEASQYLAKVSQEYISHMAISNYLRSRHMPTTPFVREEYSEPDYAPELNTQNKKLLFCQHMIELQQTIASTSGEVKARAELEMANWLFQASSGGDFWAISEYSWSYYDPKHNELSLLAIELLQDALRHTHDYNTQVECNFGLAAIDVRDESALCYDSQNNRNVIATQSTQLQAYQWLRQQTDRSHPLFETCDWLKLYVTSAD